MSVAKLLHQDGLIYATPQLPCLEMPSQRRMVFIFRENVSLSFTQIFWSQGGSLTDCQAFPQLLPSLASSPAAHELACLLRPEIPCCLTSVQI